MQDLSSLAEGSMWPTSQAAGNMMSGRARAMSAPGSTPTDPLPPEKDQGEPVVQIPDQVPPGRDGKPPARPAWSPAAPSWGKTTVPVPPRTSQ